MTQCRKLQCLDKRENRLLERGLKTHAFVPAVFSVVSMQFYKIRIAKYSMLAEREMRIFMELFSNVFEANILWKRVFQST